ncbi:hypothetical protein BSKO_02138 [Bryopsis sp. KO-2023]|nr:hypothetical protein BSKO_02138 [Bryopsis sp. KO-2023]
MRRWIRVTVFAASVRLLLLVSVLSFSGWFKNYDTSAELNVHNDCHSGSIVESTKLSGDGWERFLENVVVWDSVYFVRIARCGYEFEQTHAFFPGFPWLVRTFGEFLRRCLSRRLDVQAAYSLSGLIISNLAYVVSIVLFDDLSSRVLNNELLSAVATVFYSVPPSSVFLSAAYTEGPFCMFTMAALWLIFAKNSTWTASLIIAASCAVRSNGILHIGFLGHFALSKCVQLWPRSKPRALGALLELMVPGIVAATPLIVFQYQGYARFCEDPHQSVGDGAVSGIAQIRPWCQKGIPYLYGFVQDHYWNVGFLRYFEAKQIPNFLIAAPTLSLSVIGCYAYISRDWLRTRSLGLVPGGKSSSGFHNDKVAPFIYQWAFMALYAFLVMYVQVVTRFLSACPPFYWYVAHLWMKKRWKMLWLWFIAFAGLGSLMFPNFYPWT